MAKTFKRAVSSRYFMHTAMQNRKCLQRQMSVQCGKAYVADDIIVMNGTDDELTELQTRLEHRRLAAKVSRSFV